jgi:hypothetical protein
MRVWTLNGLIPSNKRICSSTSTTRANNMRVIRKVVLGLSYKIMVLHLVEARRPFARIEASSVGRGAEG